MTTHSNDSSKPILIGLGANLTSRHGAPRETIELALASLSDAGVTVAAVAPMYESAPVPASDQPWFVNTVAELETGLQPEELLSLLHKTEEAFGRVRRERWEARVLDIDLLDYRGLISQDGCPILPHPRMADRAFVLLPLRCLAPEWCHPVTGTPIDDLIAALPADQEIRQMVPDDKG
ncbi:MAG: 2-amino-4-hydroxy-6-hydroxymethyldihydropteridine diphosphokinase [Pseudomonadota bacterium]